MRGRVGFVIVALALVLCARSAVAQTPDVPIWYPQQNTVRMHVESWQDGAWMPLDNGTIALHGWAWHCGGVPPLIGVYRTATTATGFTTVAVPGVTVEAVYRPDVRAAFADLPCSIGDYSGFVVRVPLPAGTHQLVVQGYVSGGLWRPDTGIWAPASSAKRVHVVVAALQ